MALEEKLAKKIRKYAFSAAKQDATAVSKETVVSDAQDMMTSLEGLLTESVLDAAMVAAKKGDYDKEDFTSAAVAGIKVEK
jgi:hypothetical protein